MAPTHSCFSTLHARVWIADFSGCDMYKWFLALRQDCTPTDESKEECQLNLCFLCL